MVNELEDKMLCTDMSVNTPRLLQAPIPIGWFGKPASLCLGPTSISPLVSVFIAVWLCCCCIAETDLCAGTLGLYWTA